MIRGVSTVLRRSFQLALGFAIGLIAVFPEAGAADNSAENVARSAAHDVSAIELGPSQGAHCKSAQSSSGDDRIVREQCIKVMHLLTLMSKERRDGAWADNMETGLSDWIKHLSPKGITPRNVECRLSWCIVEVGSANEDLLEMPPQDEQKRRIYEVLHLFAPDIDDPGTTDIMVFFKRYCTSLRELVKPGGELARDFETVGQRC